MMISPELWSDFSVAALLRPPEHLFPLFWHQIVSLCISIFGLEVTTVILRCSGFLVLIVSGYLVAKLAMLFLSTSHAWVSKLRSGRILRFMLGCLASGLFCLSEPVWRSAQSFSPDMFRLLLFLLMITYSIRAICAYRFRDIVIAGILTGVVAAESALGFISLAAFAVLLANGFFDHCDKYPFARRFAAGNFSSCFVVGFVFTVASNLYFYYSNNATKSFDGESFGVALYFARYIRVLFSHIHIPGACILFVAVIAPFVYAYVIRNRAIDIDSPFPMAAKLLFAFGLVLSIFQSFNLSHFWFYSWLGNSSAVCTNFILLLSLMLTSLTASFSLCALLIDLFFRNYARYQTEQAAVLGKDIDSTVHSQILSRRGVEIFLGIIFVSLCAILVYPKINSLYSQVGDIATDAAKAIAKDCGDQEIILTDGSLDPIIECLVAMNGESIRAMSVMSTKEYDGILRTRGETNEEQRVLLELSAAKALAVWARTKNPRLGTLATQVGFEAWSQNNLPTPCAGGLLAREKWNKDSDCEESIKFARDLSQRILDLRKKNKYIAKEVGHERYRFLSHIQFRLARLAQLRAAQALSRGADDLAKEEQELSDSLDNANPEYMCIRDNFRRIARANAMKLTAREGLEVGFFLRDLNFSRLYAEQLIRIMPDDFKANYALGMGALMDKEYVRAESCLLKCLQKRNDDPIVLNNLAVIYLKLNRLEEAKKCASRACEIAPKVEEFKKTFDDINTSLLKSKEK